MKKFGKLLIAGLLVGGLTIPLAGCIDPEPFVPPEGGGSSNVLINDAYDWNGDETGSTRPELGGGYEAAVPPTAVDVTIAESSAVRFKDGSATLKVPVGTYLKQSDFDGSTLDGHTVGGFAVLDETGDITSFGTLDKFISVSSVTVIPYFKPDKGESVTFGSKKVGDYYYDENGTDISKNADYAITVKNELIENYIGQRVSNTQPLGAGSYFRAVTVLKRESGKTYTYHYGFKNYGEEAVAFTVYQMFSGHAWAAKENRVASDIITLEPNEYKTVDIKVRNTANDANTLTLIKFEEDVNSFDVGVTMAAEDNAVRVPAKITLNLPEGFTVANTYNTDVTTGDLLVLPAKEQIINETGHKLLNWVYSNSNETPVTEGTVIKGNVTIEPLLTQDAVISFVGLPEDFIIKPEYETLRQTGDRLTLPTDDQIVNSSRHRLLYWEYAEGGLVSNESVLTEDVALRPVFTKDVHVTLDLPDGLTVSSDYGRIMQEGDKLVLPADGQIINETGHKIIRWVDGDGNPVDGNTVVNTDVTILPELSQSATINVVLPDGLTISDDYATTVQTGDILVLPTAEQITGTIADGRTVLGWYEVGNGNVILTDGTIITEKVMTIAPYFSKAADVQKVVSSDASINGSDLAFGNEQSSGKPNNVNINGSNSVANFSNMSADGAYTNAYVISGGEGGYAELGRRLDYSGTIPTGSTFRCNTIVSDGTALVALNTPHTFILNFENFGATPLDFTIQGVNSGVDAEGPTVRVVLQPGESIRVSYTVSFTKGGANKNVMVYFTMNAAVTNMRLGVSINVKLNDTSAAAVNSVAEGVDLSDAYLGAALNLKVGEET